MTTATDYSDEEWQTLTRLPLLVTLAVMGAGSSDPLQRQRERAALTWALQQTRQRRPANTLVAAVAEAADAAEGATEPPPAGDGDGAQRLAVDEAARAATVLEQRSTPQEAEGYKRWVLAIARTVAAAAREGSLLGIGGVQVSTEERASVEAIAAALGVPL